MAAPKKRASFRFYGRLDDILARGARRTAVRYSFSGQPSVKDAIEAQGVPHPEVDLILRNGTPVGLDASLEPGDRVSVYPWIDQLERPARALRPPLPSPLRFVCDVHLGRLARRLRMMGFDTRYGTDRDDAALARISDEEDRILLSRDRKLLMRRRVRLGLFVRSEAPDRQLVDLVQHLQLRRDAVRLFSRCLECNTPLQSAPASVIEEQVPPHARRVNDTFRYCPACDAVYWKGSHVDRMRRLIESAFEEAGS